MISQKQNFVSKLKRSCWYHLKCLSDSSVVPSFLVRKVENESSPCTQNLGERTRQIKIMVRQQLSCTNSQKEFRRCCSDLAQKCKAFSVPKQEPVPRGSSTCTGIFLSRLFSQPDWLSLGLRGWQGHTNFWGLFKDHIWFSTTTYTNAISQTVQKCTFPSPLVTGL